MGVTLSPRFRHPRFAFSAKDAHFENPPKAKRPSCPTSEPCLQTMRSSSCFVVFCGERLMMSNKAGKDNRTHARMLRTQKQGLSHTVRNRKRIARLKRKNMDLAQRAGIVDTIHDTLNDFVGQRLKVRANMGRSKIIESEGVLTQVHPRLFIMELGAPIIPVRRRPDGYGGAFAERRAHIRAVHPRNRRTDAVACR